ncbi:MAG: elongation factor G [Peptostreptococcaceae bacterium]|nr:elongation factor G [Peptostreptococcaceae bacterium]
MNKYKVEQIRNVALMGHGGSGKTMLTERLLYMNKQIKRMGKVEDGNTVSDFDKEEISRGFTIGTSVIPLEWNNSKYNLLDTPGYFDFSGEVFSALRVSGGAIIMVDATSGVEVGTEKAWKFAEEWSMPRIIFINKMDKENVNYEKVLTELKERLGKKVAPFAIPIGKEDAFNGFINVVDMVGRELKGSECVDVAIPEGMEDQIANIREMLIESVAESDEEFMEKYFEGEEFTMEEIHAGLRKGVLSGAVVPVLLGSVEKGVGMHTLMNMIFDYMPTPKDMHEGVYKGTNPDDESETERAVDENGPFSALVFKTIVDPFIGKISLFKVYSGKAKKDMEFLNANKDEKEKFGSIFLLRGKNQLDVDEVTAGDIGATAKLQYAETGDTLCDKASPIRYEGIKVKKANLFMAIEPKSKGDEEKIGTSLHKLSSEDPTFTMERNKETKQFLIGGLGIMHLGVITNKLKNNYGVEVELADPKIAYRETIKGKSDVQGKHKKQSGGAGQYGDVHIKFEPSEEVFEFEDKIFGGSVPRNYIPAVEKGLHDSIDHGPLAGYPVVNVKAILYDGSYHPVDSSEMAFKIAASVAFKKGIAEAKPILLEPVMKVDITIPEEYLGDIMGDMNKRRGRILGMEVAGKGEQGVKAEAPMSEMFKYAIDLKSMTQAKGEFSMEFERYDEVPKNLADKIIEEAKREEE